MDRRLVGKSGASWKAGNVRYCVLSLRFRRYERSWSRRESCCPAEWETMTCMIVEKVVGASDGEAAARLGTPCEFGVLELKCVRKTKLGDCLESGGLLRDNDGL